MQAISNKGLSIATDQAVLSMHQDLTALHIQLLQQIDETQEEKGRQRDRERGRHHFADIIFLVNQERVLHKIEEAKEARVTYNTMRRRHEDQLLQQESEQQALAQMQVQMKLALLRQQKAEQMAYGQSMQSERLNRLVNQRAEYEKTLANQREVERMKLITLEEQVYQQQFGKPETGPVAMETAPYMAPPPMLYNAPPPESFATSYAGPLPAKVDPPPYHQTVPFPSPTQMAHPPTQMVHPPTQMAPPPTLYQPPTLFQPPELVPPTQPAYNQYVPQYVAPPSLAPQPYTMPSTTEMPLYDALPPQGPSLLQRVPSVPPLISFD